MITFMRIAAVSCLAFASALPAMAQSLRADIPFDFQVADRGMSAGHYVVSIDVFSHRVVLDDSQGQYVNALFQSAATAPDGRTGCSLVFHRYGEQYFLREVRTAVSGVGLPVSRDEKFVQRAARENRGPKMAMVRITAE